MIRKTLCFAGVALITAAAALGGEATRWLNVHVVDGHDDTTVELRLPMSLVLTVLKAVDTDEFRNGRVDIELDDCDVDWMAIMNEVRAAPDGDYVKVDDRDAHVTVVKRAGVVTIDVNDKRGDEHVRVTIPARVLDAFRLDEDNRLDVAELVARLDASVTGDLVRVTGDDTNVRVWVE